ncbi:pseudouridine synthase [Chromatiaceae bacterium AAb-1]|nr:pseudouridine synthase [Chromatiaceae bacterium AAb-1]
MSIARHASEITLPPNQGWQTVLQFLCVQFPFIPATVWQERIAAGKVHWYQGLPITSETPYAAGKRLCYYREVAAEPVIPSAHHILYQDDHILIACKPHYLPVTPGGEYVNECLLERVRRDTRLEDIAPVHRLDRETAGLVLFSVNPQSRAAYYELFSGGRIRKHYQAVARLIPDYQSVLLPKVWHIENHISKSKPAFIMKQQPDGEINARSEITLTARREDIGLFDLQPYTGKTHQLRLHMLSLGMPILHDKYYPQLQPKQPPQFDKPLQLLASTLHFTDPVSGKLHHFRSERQLTCWPA